LVKQKIKTKKLLISVQLSEETVNKTEGGDGLDEDKYVDEVDKPGTKFDSKTRTTVRNLRIREDTAKYLYNFDPKSPFYDPKSRSMRENPFKNMNKDPSELKYAGENFTRHTGDVMGFAHQQIFAWDAYKHGTDVHPEAEPTALTLMQKEFNASKDEFKTDLQQSILDKYGGDEHLDMPSKELLLAQTVYYYY
jgi:pre-mRNA-processing factor SLU7